MEKTEFKWTIIKDGKEVTLKSYVDFDALLEDWQASLKLEKEYYERPFQNII